MYNMFGFFRQCVEVYCALARIKPDSLRNVATPGMDDHLLKREGFEEPGHMSLDAAKIIISSHFINCRIFLKMYKAHIIIYGNLQWAVNSDWMEAVWAKAESTF